MQLNGINIQPKIGSEFQTQYGEGNTVNAASTMQQAASPSAQMYNNQARINQTINPEKISEDFAKYSNSQANLNRLYHGI